MREVVVSVEGLGKKFLIGHQKSGDLRQAFGQTFRSFLQKDRSRVEAFWALKDINFEIRRGEVVGIIGRNGAGKSTLLKILSRITSPTTGRFSIDGRVSSLLEVGTGFHSELTGRENIFLNGTILGMRRAEIKAKFDEIVAFSGVENFIDTPVKHYSSGMKVRLAFSVAAHLEPEILIIDEVLAVGDAQFQKKCLGKMDDVSKREGRTVLFVSHNMTAVEGLCQTGLLLDKGRIGLNGTIKQVIEKYVGLSDESEGSLGSKVSEGSGVVLFEAADFIVENDRGGFHSLDPHEGTSQIPFNCGVKINLKLVAKTEYKARLYVAITIFNDSGIKVSTLDNLFIDQPFYFSGDTISISCKLKKVNLNPGAYYCSLWASDGFETIQKIDRAIKFQVVENDYLGTAKSHTASKHGVVYIDQEWSKA